jgi:hypothetical protein
MKDYVIGSDEYLVKAIDAMQEYVVLTSCLKHPKNNEEQPPDDNTAPNGPWTKTGPSTTRTQTRRPFTPSTTSSEISTISTMKSQRERRMKIISKLGTYPTP